MDKLVKFAKEELRRDKCRDIISFMLENRCSIRDCSKELNIPKSTVHRYIHTYIKQDFDEEYFSLCNLLRYNKKHRCIAKKYMK